jgi:hypothetical protein
MQLPDAYWWRARLAPTLLVMLPAAVLAASFVPVATWPAGAWSLLGSVVLLLLGSLGRDAGRRSQPRLFAAWGGAPTIQRLRYRDAVNPLAVDRVHQLLRSMPNGFAVPDRAAEAADPVAADQASEVIVAALRELTRNRKSFPLVFAENTEYGFRRNLRALKRFGILVSVATLVGCVAAVVPLGLLVMHQVALVFLAPLVCAVAALYLWTKADDDWVRIPAEAYADRLVGAVEILAHPAGS